MNIITNIPADPLHTAQLEREEQSRVNGQERYLKNVANADAKGNTASTTPNVRLQKLIHNEAADGVQRWIDETMKSNRAAHKGRVVSALGAHHAAFLALQFILNSLGEPLTKVALALGQDIEDNVNLAIAMDTPDAGGLIRHLLKTKYKGAGHQYMVYGLDRVRRQQLGLPTRAATQKGADMMLLETDEETGEETILNVALTADERASLGQSIILAVCQSVGHFTYKADAEESLTGGLWQVTHESEWSDRTRMYQTTQRIRPTEHYLRFVQDGHSVAQWLRPMFEPMLCKPLDWTDPYSGGYLTHRLPVAKMSKKRLMAEHASGAFTALYATLNKLQATPLKFNTFVYETAQALWDAQAQLKCWPKGEEEVLAKPAGAEGNEDTFFQVHPEEWRTWKKAAGATHRHNHSIARMTALATIDSKLSYVKGHVEAGNPQFFQVWNADFRIRKYPVASIINTQGDDFCKSLFVFAKSKPLDEDMAYWLAVQVANCWANDKIDKKPFAERVRWVEEHKEEIYQAGTSPLDNLWWASANNSKDENGLVKESKPWQFLAACHEYAGWLEHGVGFESSLPIGVDGSCNGLQHYSALLRSESDGRLVNLVSVEQPADIYSVVAAETNKALKEARSSFAGRIDRGVAKRPTMTYAYSVSFQGIKGQLLADSAALFEHLESPKERDKAASEVAAILLKSIESVISSAANGMGLLRAVAKAAGEAGHGVTFVLPDGVRVTQEYQKFRMRKIETVVSGAIRVKKDKAALVQEHLQALTGLNQNTVKSSEKATLKSAKAFLKESGLLKLYRAEVQDLLDTYGQFDLDAFLEARYAALGLRPKADLAEMVAESVRLVISQAIAQWHLREEEVEEVDQDTGEITKKTISVTLSEPTDELDVNAQVRGAGPNVIHALDACHLRMTVAAAAAEGIDSFLMVHDSYATHAADMPRFTEIIREQFVALHENLVLESLVDGMVKEGLLDAAVAKGIKEKFLKYGTLDLQGVLDSAFFFA